MKSLTALNDQASLEALTASTMVVVSPLLTLEGEKLTPQQLYREEMQSIWDKVNQLPEGQGKVTLSQIWEYGKTFHHFTSKKFPALVVHGFIVEQLVEGECIWKPSHSYLKDFWSIGIRVSNAYGYTLQPQQAFQACLQARIYTIFHMH